MADVNYQDAMILSIEAALKLYPESSVFVLDLGMSDSAIGKIDQPNIKIYPRSILEPVWLSMSNLRQRKAGIIRSCLKYKKIPKKNLWKLLFDDRRLYFECLCLFKPLFLQHIIEERADDQFYLYLDADAFLLDRVDELAELNSFVTLRFPDDICFTFGNTMAVNAGVCGFSANQVGVDLLNRWVTRASSLNTNNFEQTALNFVVWDYHELSSEFSAAVQIDSRLLEANPLIERGGIGVGSCSTYNYYSAHLPDKAPKIVHFKGGISDQHKFNNNLRVWGLVD
jgi:hypothetical protein